MTEHSPLAGWSAFVAGWLAFVLGILAEDPIAKLILLAAARALP